MKLKLYIIILLLLTTIASAFPIDLNDYNGTYNVHFNTEPPFKVAMVVDPVTYQCHSISITSDTITISRNMITPDVYLFPTQSEINSVYEIISDGKISFIEKIELTWTWIFMQKAWVNS